MQGHWGMGPGISSLPALRDLGVNGAAPGGKPKGEGGIGFGARLVKREENGGGQIGQRIEAELARLMARAEEMLTEDRAQVLALAHALERHKTLTGDDVVAVLEGRQGPIVDGRIYADPAFAAELEIYHTAAVDAHRHHAAMSTPLPAPRLQADEHTLQGELVGAESHRGAAASTPWPPPPPPLPPRAGHDQDGPAEPRDDVSDRGGPPAGG
jgi:hypothetical protein